MEPSEAAIPLRVFLRLLAPAFSSLPDDVSTTPLILPAATPSRSRERKIARRRRKVFGDGDPEWVGPGRTGQPPTGYAESPWAIFFWSVEASVRLRLSASLH